MPETVDIGFIGTGIMGLPIAGHLISSGHRLVVHTRTRARAQPLIERGARWADSPAEAARGCAALFTIVPDTPDVEAVLFNADGAVHGLDEGSVVVDLSTIRPDAAREFSRRLAERGVALLDSPVTGGEIGARNGTLTLMAGGDAAAFERVRPLLEAFGGKVVLVGPSGAGQTLKACNQILCAVNMIGVCEALMLARAGGLDPKQAIETLEAGAGGSWAWTQLGSKIAQGDLKPAFMIDLMQKDLRIVFETARDAHLPLPGAALAAQLFEAVQAAPGGGKLGTQAMIQAYERLGNR